jgi:hypothetical protein
MIQFLVIGILYLFLGRLVYTSVKEEQLSREHIKGTRAFIGETLDEYCDGDIAAIEGRAKFTVDALMIMREIADR